MVVASAVMGSSPVAVKEPKGGQDDDDGAALNPQNAVHARFESGAVACLESGHKPSLKTLERYAEAVGMKVEIRFVTG